MTQAELICDWGGEAVVSRFDKPSGAWCFIALHDSTLGGAVGGCRMKTYARPADGLRDAMRLAEGMTYKWAAIDFPFGGGKSVLAVPPGLAGSAREGLLRRFARLIDSLNGAFSTGVDMGTTPADMGVMAEECRYIMGMHDGRPQDPGPHTALGVLVGLKAATRHGLGAESLEGVSVLVQGVGDVGAPLARLLAQEGARVTVTDMDAERAEVLADEVGGSVVAADSAYGAECDVFAPCAVGGVLSEATIPLLKARVVAGSANNQLEVDLDAERLHDAGILYAPDYVVNGGGAIAFGLMHLGEHDDAVLRERIGGIAGSLDAIFSEASAHGHSPLQAARRRAERVLVERKAERE